MNNQVANYNAMKAEYEDDLSDYNTLVTAYNTAAASIKSKITAEDFYYWSDPQPTLPVLPYRPEAPYRPDPYGGHFYNGDGDDTLTIKNGYGLPEAGEIHVKTGSYKHFGIYGQASTDVGGYSFP